MSSNKFKITHNSKYIIFMKVLDNNQILKQHCFKVKRSNPNCLREEEIKFFQVACLMVQFCSSCSSYFAKANV